MQNSKYKPYPPMHLPDRKWPSAVITSPPTWCSVDLRDGNQALPVPMGVDKKLRYYRMLREIGFREIEVAFPSASETEFEFVRTLLRKGLADDDVVIQVLTQSREPLIRRTFEAIEGFKRAIVHQYLSTSEVQRRVVFGMSREEIIAMAVQSARLIRDLAADTDADIRFEFSPESFTGTEMEYALEVCEAVLNVWQPTPDKPAIINLPATVEMTTPNVFADQVEWFGRNLSARDSVILSVHTHNDRGTGIAASELAMLAGVQRVEGTLFGNGERTGNTDIMTMALNLYSRGVDPGLRFHNINAIRETYEQCTGLTVHERHPYSGQLVYAAFSGSHQDAIRKGLIARKKERAAHWEVPYLPIDPSDIGREYEPIIRINSQSGKGGVAFVMEHDFGYHLPKAMHPEFGRVIQYKTDAAGRELSPDEVMEAFREVYLRVTGPLALHDYTIETSGRRVIVKAHLTSDGREISVTGEGNGPISAFFHAVAGLGCPGLRFETYEQHALGSGQNAEAVAYIGLIDGKGMMFGVGIDRNTTTASFKAILCAINRYITGEKV
ncbi:MAG: 2-isopropylmalate synthase [Christensenellales bacterium]|jgi:2-isopropylmalate synthase